MMLNDLLFSFATYAKLQDYDKPNSLAEVIHKLELYGSLLFNDKQKELLIGFAHFLSVEVERPQQHIKYQDIAMSVRAHNVYIIDKGYVRVNTLLGEEETTREVTDRVTSFIIKHGLQAVNMLHLMNGVTLWLTSSKSCLTYIDNNIDENYIFVLHNLGIIRV